MLPSLRQAAWSQLKPVYDQPAPGAGGTDMPCGSAGAEKSERVWRIEWPEPCESERVGTAIPALPGRRGSGSPEPGQGDPQNPASPWNLWQPPAGPSPPIPSSPRQGSSFSCFRTGPEPQPSHAGPSDALFDSSCGGELEGSWAAKWAEEAVGPAGCSSTEDGTEGEAAPDGSSAAHASRTPGAIIVGCGRAADRGNGWAGGLGAGGAAVLAAMAGRDCGGARGGCWCFLGRRVPGHHVVDPPTWPATN